MCPPVEPSLCCEGGDPPNNIKNTKAMRKFTTLVFYILSYLLPYILVLNLERVELISLVEITEDVFCRC